MSKIVIYLSFRFFPFLNPDTSTDKIAFLFTKKELIAFLFMENYLTNFWNNDFLLYKTNQSEKKGVTTPDMVMVKITCHLNYKA